MEETKMAETNSSWSLKSWLGPILSRNYILILIIQTVQTFIVKMNETPAGPMATALGISAFAIGLCASLYSISTIIAKPIAGAGVDRFSKRNMLVLAFVLQAIMDLCYVATGATASNALYVVSRVMHGFSYGVVNTALFAAVAAAVDKKSMGTALGVFLAVPNLVSAWGPKFSIYLYNTKSFTFSYAVAAALCVIPAVLSFFVKFDESKQVNVQKRGFNIFKGISLKAIPVCALSFFMLIGGFSNTFYRVIHLEGQGLNVGTALVYSGYLALVGRLIAGYVTDRVGAKWVVIPSIILYSLSMFMTGFCTTDTMCYLACGIGGFGYAMYQPAMQAQLFNSMPASQRGAASATWFLCMDIPGLIFVPILGKMADIYSYKIMFYFAGVAVALGLVYYLTVGLRLMNKFMKDQEAVLAAEENGEAA